MCQQVPRSRHARKAAPYDRVPPLLSCNKIAYKLFKLLQPLATMLVFFLTILQRCPAMQDSTTLFHLYWS